MGDDAVGAGLLAEILAPWSEIRRKQLDDAFRYAPQSGRVAILGIG